MNWIDSRVQNLYSNPPCFADELDLRILEGLVKASIKFGE